MICLNVLLQCHGYRWLSRDRYSIHEDLSKPLQRNTWRTQMNKLLFLEAEWTERYRIGGHTTSIVDRLDRLAAYCRARDPHDVYEVQPLSPRVVMGHVSQSWFEFHAVHPIEIEGAVRISQGRTLPFRLELASCHLQISEYSRSMEVTHSCHEGKQDGQELTQDVSEQDFFHWRRFEWQGLSTWEYASNQSIISDMWVWDDTSVCLAFSLAIVLWWWSIDTTSWWRLTHLFNHFILWDMISFAR